MERDLKPYGTKEEDDAVGGRSQHIRRMMVVAATLICLWVLAWPTSFLVSYHIHESERLDTGVVPLGSGVSIRVEGTPQTVDIGRSPFAPILTHSRKSEPWRLNGWLYINLENDAEQVLLNSVYVITNSGTEEEYRSTFVRAGSGSLDIKQERDAGQRMLIELAGPYVVGEQLDGELIVRVVITVFSGGKGRQITKDLSLAIKRQEFSGFIDFRSY